MSPHASSRRRGFPPALVLLLLIPVLSLTFCKDANTPNGGPEDPPASPGSGEAETPPTPAPEQEKLELEASAQAPLRLVFSTYMNGHLEPCGCASAQSGGLDRRAFWLQTRKDSYDAILEGGNLVAGRSPFEELKLLTILQVLGANLEYPALPLGPKDLELGSAMLRDYDGAFGPPFVATDLRDASGKAPLQTFAKITTRSEGSYQVLILSLIGELSGEKPREEQLQVVRPEKAVAEALAAAGTRGKDYHLVVVFSNSGGATGARAIASRVPGVDLVVATDQPDDVAQEKYETYVVRGEGRPEEQRHLLFVGGHGKTLLRWTGVPSKQGPWITSKTEKIRLDKPTPDPEVEQVLLAFKRSLPEEGILERMAEQRPSRNGHEYVGSEKCATCHAPAMEVWKKTKHAHAWQTLIDREKRDKWPVTQHPDCVGCHVAGYGEKTGFVNIERTPHLKDVNCESCHGAGGRHVDFWTREVGTLKGGTPEYEAAQKAATMGKLGLRSCLECHTLEQSPGFVLRERWKEIEHR